MKTSNSDIGLYLLIGIGVVIIFVPLAMGVIVSFNDFSYELRYIKGEIKRTTGSERKYWIRQKRKLWLSLFPFVKY